MAICNNFAWLEASEKVQGVMKNTQYQISQQQHHQQLMFGKWCRLMQATWKINSAILMVVALNKMCGTLFMFQFHSFIDNFTCGCMM